MKEYYVLKKRNSIIVGWTDKKEVIEKRLSLPYARVIGYDYEVRLTPPKFISKLPTN